MSSRKDQLIAFITSNDLCSNSSNISDDEYTCVPCCFSVSLAKSTNKTENKRNLNNILSHIKSKDHGNCSGWNITFTPSDISEPFKLIKMFKEKRKQLTLSKLSSEDVEPGCGKSYLINHTLSKDSSSGTL
jgi:hypothetical protein